MNNFQLRGARRKNDEIRMTKLEGIANDEIKNISPKE
jgi:hypothetical protein